MHKLTADADCIKFLPVLKIYNGKYEELFSFDCCVLVSICLIIFIFNSMISLKVELPIS